MPRVNQIFWAAERISFNADCHLAFRLFRFNIICHCFFVACRNLSDARSRTVIYQFTMPNHVISFDEYTNVFIYRFVCVCVCENGAFLRRWLKPLLSLSLMPITFMRSQRVNLVALHADNIVNFNAFDMKWFDIIRVKNNYDDFIKTNVTSSVNVWESNLLWKIINYWVRRSKCLYLVGLWWS